MATSSKRDSMVTCAPSDGATVIACSIPVTDASGLITKMLSAAVSAAASTKLRVATSIVFSECTTPFGRDVVPDVKITIDGSSGSRAAMRGAPITGSASPMASIGEPARRPAVVARSGAATSGASTSDGSVMATMSRTCAAPALVGATITSAPSRSTGVDRDDRDDVVAVEHEAPRRRRATPSRRNAATPPSTAASSSP